jgi:hypothetical protein
MSDFISFVITYALFGWFGFALSRVFRQNPRPYTWIALALAAIISQRCFVSVRVIDVFGIVIPASEALQACFVGILAGLVRRELWPASANSQ